MTGSGIAVPCSCGIGVKVNLLAVGTVVKVNLLAVGTVGVVPRGMCLCRGPVIMVRYNCTCAEWACAWAIDGTRGRGIFL